MKDESSSKSLDVLGVKPVAEAVNTVTKGMVDGAGAFLSRICLPAAEEFGLMLRDKVCAYRANNVAKIAAKAEAKLAEQPQSDHVHGHPRLIGLILEHGSWIEVDDVQGMWAGLLASSCTADGEDDSNLMFVDSLTRLSSSQARLLDHACHDALKSLTPGGLVLAEDLTMKIEDLRKVTGVDDIHRLDRELDHLRELGLINPMSGGFESGETATADVTPTGLALQMFVRLNGYRDDPVSFFGLTATE